MCISIPVYSIYLQMMSNLHTHVTVSFGGVMYSSLREGMVEEIGKVWNEYESSDRIEIT